MQSCKTKDKTCHCHPRMCWRDWQVNGGCVLLSHLKAATERMQRSFGFSVICGLRLVCSANSGQVSSAGGQFWVEKPDNQLKSSPGATRGGLRCPCLVDLSLPLVQPCTLGLYGLLPLFYALGGCWTHWDAVLLPAWSCTQVQLLCYDYMCSSSARSRQRLPGRAAQSMLAPSNSSVCILSL